MGNVVDFRPSNKVKIDESNKIYNLGAEYFCEHSRQGEMATGILVLPLAHPNGETFIHCTLADVPVKHLTTTVNFDQAEHIFNLVIQQMSRLEKELGFMLQVVQQIKGEEDDNAVT